MPVEEINEAPAVVTSAMPVEEINEAPAVVTSAMPVEEINDTPAVAMSAMPVEQSNDTGVTPNNEMSITVPPHLLGVVPSTTNLTVQINNYVPFPLKAHVKCNGKKIEIDQSNEACLPQGPPFYKWAIKHLVPADMIETIRSEAPLEAQKLKTLVRGIRPRVDAKANPRAGEPTDYVLVLGDIIHANEPGKRKDNVMAEVRTKFDKGKYADYKSACLCNIVHDVNGSVSLQ